MRRKADSMDSGYQIERRLAALDRDLHKRYCGCVTVSSQLLTRYEGVFPTYTDHSALHTLEIVDYCNQLTGRYLDRLTADDLYVLLMGALFHDVGMGISQRDYVRFAPRLGLPGLEEFPRKEDWADLIRDNHQDLSALYVEQYADFFDIPNPRYVRAITQVCRGHRKTDLMDPEGYPPELEVLPGQVVHLPYLAALLCLADELDVAADRNISFLYDIDRVNNPVSQMEFRKHQAIRAVDLEEQRVVIHAESGDPELRKGVVRLSEKLEEKLQICRAVVAARTPFSITQERVCLEFRTTDPA